MLSVLIVSAILAAGAPQAVASTAPSTQTATATKPEEKLICRRAANIGSNIPTKKMCYTRAQWDAASRMSQATKRSMEPAWTTPNMR